MKIMKININVKLNNVFRDESLLVRISDGR